MAYLTDRRGVKRRADGTQANVRTTSDHSSSSTSSDILVASAPYLTRANRPQRSINNRMPVTARVARGKLMIKGCGNLLKHLRERDYRRDTNQSADHYFRTSGRVQNGSNKPSDSIGFYDESTMLLEDDHEEGPNHKGTYSKAYTLRHPEFTWVHRGQGRYLPTSSTPKQTPRSQATSVPQRMSNQTTSCTPVRSSLRRRRGDSDDDEDEDGMPRSRPQAPSNAKRSSATSYSLRRPPSVPGEPSLSQLRAARSQRRSNAFVGDDENEEAVDDDDSDEDINKTYIKEYVEDHPGFNWRHCGNGFYKKVRPAPPPPVLEPRRRSSNRSLMQVSTYVSDHDRRYHKKELTHYPGVQFRHCGNGWYRRESAFADDNNTFNHESDEDGSEYELGPRDGKFTKEQMVAYKTRYPDAEFTHRGNGRYVLADTWDTFEPMSAPTDLPAPTSPEYIEDPKKTFDKAYVEAHPEERFHHAGSGRYRRGSRPAIAAVVTKQAEPTPEKEVEEPGFGMNKTGQYYLASYVRAHPELEFHHKGLGRYALGPRPGRVVGPTDASLSHLELETTPQKTASPSVSGEDLVTTAYVDAHCDKETFYHRGQGRWARGLPAPGSSNKTAVRGPDASLAKLSRTPSNGMVPTVPEVELPGVDELLVRSEGPDKFPQLTWVYRGGGRWAQRTRQDEIAAANATHPRASKGKGRARQLSESDDEGGEDGGAEAQIERETQAVEAASFYGTPVESRRPSAEDLEAAETEPAQRNRTSLYPPDAANASRRTSKNPSVKSKTATPKPQRMTLEKDRLDDPDNYPALYADEWPAPGPDDPDDAASALLRETYRPLNPASAFVDALVRHDPSMRPKAVLVAATAHVQALLRSIQDEYIALDKITAPHARIARKPARGGRLPVDAAIFEDKKEADLYDYAFDVRKIGYQDPESQRIVRDAEGRELRKRRNRSGLDVTPANITGTEEFAPRRAVKPIHRFENASQQAPKRRKRTAAGATKGAISTTLDPSALILPGGYQVHTSGRWAGHIPKRIRELRGDSMGSVQSGNNNTSPDATPGVEAEEAGAASTLENGTSSSAVANNRKGRPKGSKNLHKRRDAGIPKGPRKAKVVASIENMLAPGEGGESEARAEGVEGMDGMDIDQMGDEGEQPPGVSGVAADGLNFKAPGNGVSILQ